MRPWAVTLMLFCVLSVSTPFVAHAQTAEQLRQQISALLSQIQALQAQLQSNTTSTVVPSTTTSSGGATFQYSGCPDLQFNLERGNRDAQVAVEVTMLQRFLAQDRTLYPEGEITGYFGPATERAVQRFQERHGIVTQGDYASTGYGRVGPRTRWAIKNSCVVGGVATPTATGQTHGFTVSPVTGKAPLTVEASFSIEGSSCTSYSLDWGDGSVPVIKEAANTTNCTKDISRNTATHTYSTSGMYMVNVRIGKGAVSGLPTVGTLRVEVLGPDENSYPTDPNAHAYPTFSTTQGYAPFTAGMILHSDAPLSCTSYEIDWGDGTQAVRKEAGNSPCIAAQGYTREFRHVYQNPGVYTARVRAGRAALDDLQWKQQTLTILARTGSTSGCFVEPNAGVAPHSVRARVLLGGSLCDGNLTYTINWGDGQTTPLQTCTDQNSHYAEFTHTYIAPAVYTARLQQAHPNAYFDEQACTVHVTKAATTPGNNAITSSCRSWTDGCNTCTRSFVGGPETCTKRYCIQASTPQCYQYFDTSNAGTNTNDSLRYRIVNAGARTVEFTAEINTARSCDGGFYTIHFGDSNSSPQPYPADACTSYTRTVSYRYTQDGTFTAVLIKDGVVIDQVTITIDSSSAAVNKQLASVIVAIENFIRSIFK